MWGLSLSTYVFSLPTYVIDNSAIKCLVNCDLFWISSTNHRQLCRMLNIWHLRHQTLKTKYCVKCIKILRYTTVTFYLSFFASLHLLCSRLYLLLSFFPPFFPFLSLSLCAFAFSISFFFPYHSPSLSFFFSPPRALPLRSAVVSSALLWSSASPMRPLPWRYLILISLCFFYLFIYCDYGLWLGMVVAGCAVYGAILLKILSFFFFFSSFVVVFV